jgi:hypothetical protein
MTSFQAALSTLPARRAYSQLNLIVRATPGKHTHSIHNKTDMEWDKADVTDKLTDITSDFAMLAADPSIQHLHATAPYYIATRSLLYLH